MRTGNRSCQHSIWAACLLAPVALLACEQPGPRCSVARGPFAARYTLLSGSGDCATLRGEVLSVQAYQEGLRSRKASFGIQPQSITDLLYGGAEPVEPDPEDVPYSLGAFADPEARGNDFCVVPTLTRTRFRLPGIEAYDDLCGTVPAEAAVDISYEWSNIRVYTTAAAYGTQFSANLTYTKDGCTASYSVEAVYPAVSCDANEAVDGDQTAEDDQDPEGDQEIDGDEADGDMCPEPEPEPPDLEPLPDDTLCSPAADPVHGRPVGSGINVAFDVHCDPELLLCVLSKEPPSLR